MTLKLPRLAETADEFVVIEVVKQVGDGLQVGDAILVVETDKANAEVVSPVEGTLVELLVGVDAEVNTGDAYAVVES